MTRLRVPRVLGLIPAPVRWLTPPIALGCTVVLLLGSWGAPEEIEVPAPTGRAAGYCRELAGALPRTLLGHPRKDPSPASPYVAVWGSDPRTVLRCGVDHPEELTFERQSELSPTINDVTWFAYKLDDGGYRFTTTQRAAFVELTVPGGAFANPLDPASALSDVVREHIPA